MKVRKSSSNHVDVEEKLLILYGHPAKKNDLWAQLGAAESKAQGLYTQMRGEAASSLDQVGSFKAPPASDYFGKIQAAFEKVANTRDALRATYLSTHNEGPALTRPASFALKRSAPQETPLNPSPVVAAMKGAVQHYVSLMTSTRKDPSRRAAEAPTGESVTLREAIQHVDKVFVQKAATFVYEAVQVATILPKVYGAAAVTAACNNSETVRKGLEKVGAWVENNGALKAVAKGQRKLAEEGQKKYGINPALSSETFMDVMAVAGTGAFIKTARVCSRSAQRALRPHLSPPPIPLFSSWDIALVSERRHVEQVLKAMKKANPISDCKDWESRALRRMAALDSPVRTLDHFLEAPGTQPKVLSVNDRSIVQLYQISSGRGGMIVEKESDFLSVAREMHHLDMLQCAAPKYFSVPQLLGARMRMPEEPSVVYMTQQPGVPFVKLLQQETRRKDYPNIQEAFISLGKAHAELHSIRQEPFPPSKTQKLTRDLSKFYEEVEKQTSGLKLKSPYTLEEISALIEEFEKAPQVRCLVHDDPHLRNVLWDAEKQVVSLIDIGSCSSAMPPHLSMEHCARGISDILALIERSCSWIEASVPEKEHVLLRSFFLEGYNSVANPIIPVSSLQFMSVHDIYKDLAYELSVAGSVPDRIRVAKPTYKYLEKQKPLFKT